MKRVLRFEWFGATTDQAAAGMVRMVREVAPGVADDMRAPTRRPWVAEITGRDHRFGFARKFVDGDADYADSNSQGTRGVYLQWLVDDSKVYEVCYWESWRSRVRKFVRWEQGQMVDVPKQDVELWVVLKRGT